MCSCIKENEAVVFENITFVREGNRILDGVSWTINKGEKWAFLGLNGSGKSTLLNMIPAYTFPTRGNMRIFKETFGKYPWMNIRKKVGFVSSSLGQFSGRLNVQKTEEIILSGKNSTIGIYETMTEEDTKKADELIKEFKIDYLKGKVFENFSQGEQRKVLLARAFMNNPELIVLDEPCSGLDLKSREFFLNSLREVLKGKETPIIYVTHDITEIIEEITHVAILGSDGKMLGAGEKKEILTNENISKLYELDIEITWKKERPWIIINE